MNTDNKEIESWEKEFDALIKNKTTFGHIEDEDFDPAMLFKGTWEVDNFVERVKSFLHQELQKAYKEGYHDKDKEVSELLMKDGITYDEINQLQKARHEWLREEIVKLEGLQKRNEAKEVDAPFVQHEIWAYSNALKIIINHYQSELDQPLPENYRGYAKPELTMPHTNNKEGIEEIVAQFELTFTINDYECNGHRYYPNLPPLEISRWLRTTLHQELQKARADTLKEVIGIIESVQVTAQKMSANDTRPEKAKMINDWLMPEVKRNIVEAIQSELDQPINNEDNLK